MAALCSSLEADDLLSRGHADQNFRQAFSRKRSRGADNAPLSEPRPVKDAVCDIGGAQRSLSARFSWDMSQALSFHPMERSFSYEVSALRAAAAAAVAEFSGSIEPGFQLTAPGKAHERQGRDGLSEAEPRQGGKVSFEVPERRASGSRSLGTAFSGAAAAPGVLADPRTGQQPGDDVVYTQRGCPPHGAKAICGRRPRMEDAYTAFPFLLEVPVPPGGVAQPEVLPPRIAPQVRSASTSPHSSDCEGTKSVDVSETCHEAQRQGNLGEAASSSQELPSSEEPYLETLHFFGVFDGHGGAEAALHCAQTLHQHIADALAAATERPNDAEPGGHKGVKDGTEDGADGVPDGPVSKASLPGGLRPVEDAVDTGSERNADAVDDDHAAAAPDGVNSVTFESALTSAFNRTDEEFGKADNAALVGTTAVVTLVGSRQLYVANCGVPAIASYARADSSEMGVAGDSRAVLSRAGMAIPLTDDHKAAREDETARVEAAGGQILFWNGVRVMGVLAVSRAIGDHCLRPYVIAQPEITILARRPDDELLLLASDGLWDVLSNQEACTLAKRCLRRARQRGASRQSAARIAATVLTRAAVDRGSRDNVTVLVVDLANGAADADAAARTQSAALVDKSKDSQEDDSEDLSTHVSS